MLQGFPERMASRLSRRLVAGLQGAVDGAEHEQALGRRLPALVGGEQASTADHRHIGLRVAWALCCSAGAVDVRAMVDPDDSHCGWVVLYLVHDPVGPPAGCP